MPDAITPGLQRFLDDWKEDVNNIKGFFEAVYKQLAALDGLELEYKGRPGVSHSLRARHKAQKTRLLFVLVDVIDDDPAARWLSVCFYADLVTDPEDRGDIVPGGLMGEDACCFDMEQTDDASMAYLQARLSEAAKAAAKGD